MAGTKAEAASENEAATMGRMSDGRCPATSAASSATAISTNLETMTRCSGEVLRGRSWKYRSRTRALLMVSSRPSAVDSAAASPPAATRPATTYGRPPISGVASMIRSAPRRSSPNCSTPSPLTSSTDSSEASTRAHCAIQFGSSSKRTPTRLFITSSLISAASAGAVRYSRAMKNRVHATEVRAADTEGTV